MQQQERDHSHVVLYVTLVKTGNGIAMPSISVIICTRNPRPDYLRRVLNALEAQTLPKDQWELLVIDNASHEPLAQEWKLHWHRGARHIREDEPGLTPARLRGIKEAIGDLLVFVDDDNILAPDFLQLAGVIAEEHPFLGVFGAGALQPEFEVNPPKELESRLPLLALRHVEAAVWTNNSRDFGCIPWGAGLCVTRRLATYYPRFVEQLNVTKLLDRREQHLFAGGDDLFSWAAVATGQGFGLFPQLRVTHLISAERLSQRYFFRLIHDSAFSHGVLQYLLLGTQSQSSGLEQYVRLLLHTIRHGVFSMRCQWARKRGADRASHFISEHGLEPAQVPSPVGFSARDIPQTITWVGQMQATAVVDGQTVTARYREGLQGDGVLL
jgi:glycosyltransferase involved in cell wall biosynthesis